MSEVQPVDKAPSEALAFESKSNSPVEVDSSLLQDTIVTTDEAEKLTESSSSKPDTDQVSDDKTIENSEQTNSKTSRELKLLLALSKEANLDTNISYKRKTLEGGKSKDKESALKVGTPETDSKRTSKVAHENRNVRYPVTAEAELEFEIPEADLRNVADNSIKTSKRKRDSLSEVNIGGATEEVAKRNRKSFSSEITMLQPKKDMFCWRCHRQGVNIACETCPRAYHQKCLKQTINNSEHWPCPECVSILKAESTQTRSEAMKGMTLEHLCSLLKFAVNRMIQCQGSEPFLHPVSETEFPEYKKYIIQPMDLTKVEKNIKENLYGSTQAFEADTKWLLHNSIIFNSYQSKLTTAAKNIVKICKQEMSEIENCPTCYLNANTKKGTWFIEVCPKPHILIWAKLKGFPYWPAKAMCTNPSGMVDVRFFGAHDRAWVHYKECYLFSERDPNTFKQKRYDIEKCVEELNLYIENLRKVYGDFRYAPFKIVLDPSNEMKQLQMFLPKYKVNLLSKKKDNFKIERMEPKFESNEDNKCTDQNSEAKENKEQPNINVKDTDSESMSNKLAPTHVRTKAEMKENIPEAKKNDTSPKQNLSELKTNEILSPPTYKSSKCHDNDTSMEGYGTDDDADTEIDIERRKTFIDKKADCVSAKNDATEEEEDEEDSDTQVPSNISISSSPIRGHIRTRGGLANPTGTIKVLPQRISNEDSTTKRQSTEDKTNSPLKMSRRNSDQSVKSDSSRVSNISDKINRVDISENMEVMLGNDDVNCVSISENISSNSSSESSKSGSECSIENKRKPVQVDIENNEFTISPSNKLKISDKLMKRLSDVDENSTRATQAEEAKRSLVEKKSPTDILIEKFKGVVEHKIVDFSQPSTSSETENQDNTRMATASETVKNINVNNKETDLVVPVDQTLNSKISSCNESNEDKSISEKRQSVNSLKNYIAQDVTTHKANATKTLISETKSKEGITENQVLREANVLNIEGGSKQLQEIKNSQPTESSDELSKKSENLRLTVSTSHNNNNNEKTGNSSNLKEPTNPEMNIIEEIEDSEEMEVLDDIEIDKNNIFNIIHSSLNDAKLKNISKKEVLKCLNPSVPDAKSTSKKRKSIFEECNNSQAKLVKLVPLENMLKGHDGKESYPLRKSLPAKKIIDNPLSASSTPASSVSRQSSFQDILPEDIKSEPETDDDFIENENLDAKRKYLSALNISEKISDFDKKKGNEIRTRSKTEEKREKFKVVDNLTRIIDDVALNYSAVHEGQDIPPKKPERRKSMPSVASTPEGEIYVKSFAKIQAPKQRARKSFPIPPYLKANPQISLLRKESPQSTTAPKKEVPKSNSITIPLRITSSTSNVITTQSPKPTEPGTSSMSHVILLQSNQAGYSNSLVAPILSVVTPVVSTTITNSTAQSRTPSLLKTGTPNLRASQNYIPQNEERNNGLPNSSLILNGLLTQPIANTEGENQPENTENQSNAPSIEPTTERAPEEDLGVLNSLLPENVSRAVSDLLLRPPPRLKPRPPGMLSTVFEEGIPSSAGNVTAKINSIAHRLGDYLRGMLIETLQELGKSPNPETTITNLQMEIETLKYQHSVEISEMKKNVSTILKDIQKSIVEEREKVVEETRAACEAETIKRVELAKSKQWCANCSKEAQFYCCWNTSYCDYPCQQKHWPQHLGKCTQSIEKTSNTVATPSRPPGQQLILRPALPPKPGMGRIVGKPTKVYMNRTTGPPKSFKTIATTSNHLTVIETTPGNYELLGNGPIAVTGKFLATTSNVFHSKFKTSTVVTATSPSTSVVASQRNVQKVVTASEPSKPATPATNSSHPTTSTHRDNESEEYL